MCDFEFHLRQSGAFVQLFQYLKNDFLNSTPFLLHFFTRSGEIKKKKCIMCRVFHLREPFHLSLHSCSQTDRVISYCRVVCGESSRAVRQVGTQHSR